MEDVNTRQQFLDTVLHISFRINVQKKNSPTFDKLRVMKFETVWIRFLSDVSTAVAIVVA